MGVIRAVASRCGRWVLSLGGTLNDDQWSCVFKTSPTLCSFLFPATSQSIINPTSHFIFSKNVFVCYFCPFLSTKLFLHNYNLMTGSEM